MCKITPATAIKADMTLNLTLITVQITFVCGKRQAFWTSYDLVE